MILYLIIAHLIGMFFMTFIIRFDHYPLINVFWSAQWYLGIIFSYFCWEITLPYHLFRHFLAKWIIKKIQSIKPVWVPCSGTFFAYDDSKPEMGYTSKGFECRLCHKRFSNEPQHTVLNPVLHKLHDSWLYKLSGRARVNIENGRSLKIGY